MQTLAAIRYRRRANYPSDPKRPEERSVLFKAMCGHPIDVVNDKDFISLYHVFERIPESAKYRMLRKRVGPSRWHIFLISEPEFALLRKL